MKMLTDKQTKLVQRAARAMAGHACEAFLRRLDARLGEAPSDAAAGAAVNVVLDAMAVGLSPLRDSDPKPWPSPLRDDTNNVASAPMSLRATLFPA
jgi:hypothetical protein